MEGSMSMCVSIGEVAPRLRVAPAGAEAFAAREVTVLATLPNGFSPVRLGEDLCLDLLIRNVGTMPVKNMLLAVGPSRYFSKTLVRVPDLEPVSTDSPSRSQVVVPVELLAIGVPSLKDLDSAINFKILSADPQAAPPVCAQTEIRLGMEMFSGDALQWRRLFQTEDGPLGANLLLFGPFGSGKSSFVNLLLSALCSERQQLELTGGTTSHVTSSLRRWQLGRLCGAAMIRQRQEKMDYFYHIDEEEAFAISTWPVTVWDTWGSDKKGNYTKEDFDLLLRGYLRPGTTMRDVQGQKVVEGRLGRIITAVCLFIPQGAVLNDEEEVQRLKDYTEIATRLGRAPLILISHADEEQDETVRANMVEHISSSTHMPRDRIIFLENYTEHTDKKVFDKERVALRILLHCLKATDAFFERELTHPSELMIKPVASLSPPSPTLMVRRADGDQEARDFALPSTLEKLKEVVSLQYGIKLSEVRFWNDMWQPLTTIELIKAKAEAKEMVMCGTPSAEMLHRLKTGSNSSTSSKK